MIIKSFELEKLKSTKVKKILFYGENEGYKNQIINNFFIKNFSDNFEKYEENQILNNYEDFFSSLLNKSFFEKDKLIIINRASEKIFKLVEEISSKKIDDVTLIINSGILEKKSKLRKFFEKEINTICVPFYRDENKTLISLAYNFLNDKKISLSNISEEIIKIRESKLPDPKKIGNCGSFFKNPLIESKKLDELLKKHPQLPYHKNKNELYKIPAAWLIEKMGFKQKSLGNVGVYINQPLVIVNNGNANGSDILNFANSIKDSVKKEFNIELEEEVNII